jgi:hypothetical protein
MSAHIWKSFVQKIPVKNTEINDRGNSIRWPRNTLYVQS